MTRDELFKYGALIVISIAISFHVNVTLAMIAFGVISYYVSSKWYMHNTDKIANDYEDLDYRLSILQGLVCGMCDSPAKALELHEFPRDPTLIDLFYDSQEYARWNHDDFVSTMQNVNTILEIVRDVVERGVKYDCVKLAQHAYDKYKNAMNHWHALVYTIPSVREQVLVKKHRDVMEALQLRLLQHVQNIRDKCPSDIPPFEKYFIAGLSQPQDEYSTSEMIPTTSFERY